MVLGIGVRSGAGRRSIPIQTAVAVSLGPPLCHEMLVRSSPSGNPRAAPLPISSGPRMRSNPLVIVRGAHTGDPMADTLQLHPAFCLFLYEFDGTGQAVPSVRPAQDIASVPGPTAPPRRDVHQMPDHAWAGFWLRAGPTRSRGADHNLDHQTMGTNRDFAGALPSILSRTDGPKLRDAF
jgi:hypothetical protein